VLWVDYSGSEQFDVNYSNRALRLSVRRLLRNRAAATAMEYGLVASIVSLGILGALGSMSGSLKSTFNSTSSAMSSGNAAG